MNRIQSVYVVYAPELVSYNSSNNREIKNYKLLDPTKREVIWAHNSSLTHPLFHAITEKPHPTILEAHYHKHCSLRMSNNNILYTLCNAVIWSWIWDDRKLMDICDGLLRLREQQLVSSHLSNGRWASVRQRWCHLRVLLWNAEEDLR